MSAVWLNTLQHIVDTECSNLQRVVIIQEVDSTQDEARRTNARPGDVIIAQRQTSGRGRLGRTWADTEGHGIAVTIVIPHGQPERLAIASAVGVSAALQAASGTRQRIGIKWPNDIVAEGRKLAGILIEQTQDRALIGVGMNVSQTSWPLELQDKAVSLTQLGANCDRLQILSLLLPSIDRALGMNDEQLTHEFLQRDVLLGSTATFRCGTRVITGCVHDIDPMRGLKVHDGQSMHWLPAATTTLHAE